MILSRGKALVLAGALSVGCGGATPAPAGPNPTDSSQPALVAGEGPGGEAAPPLAPVQTPDRVFLVGRLKDPAQLMDTVESWVSLPKRWRELMESEMAGAGGVLDLAAPIDVIVAMDEGGAMQEPNFRAVFSIGLSSLDKALEFSKTQGNRAERVAPGVYRVDSSCVLARSLGRAPARLVCGDGRKSIDALLDYATRGLAAQPAGPDDISVEVNAEPFRKRYGSELPRLKRLAMPFIREEIAIGFAPFDRAVSDAATALLDEGLALTDDLDSFKLLGSVDGSAQQVRFKLELGFRGKKSWVAQRFASAGKRAKPAPLLFWDLPKDCTTASFSIGGEPQAFDPIRDALAEILDTFLAHEKVPAGPRKNLTGVVSKLWVNEGASAYGGGVVPLDPKVAVGTAAFQRETVRSSLGWHIVGLEEDSKRTLDYFDHLVKVLNDRSLRALAAKGVKPKDIPSVKRRAPKGRAPRGSVAYELLLPGALFEADWEPDYVDGGPPARVKKPAPAKALPVVLIVAPDGPYTWIGLSADEATLVNHLSTTASGDPKSTLSTLPRIEQLRAGSFVGGGFTTLSQYVESAKVGLARSGDADMAEKVLASLPNAGKTPGLLTFQVRDGAGPTLSYEFSVPKGMLMDISHLINAGFNSYASRLSVPPPMPMPAPVMP